MSAETFCRYMSRLRQALGGTEFLPKADGAGYRFGLGVTSDWSRFQALATKAERCESDQAIVALHEALSLVRGAPFAATPVGSCEWASSALLVSQMTTAISYVAHRLTDLTIAASQASDADWAAGRNLSARPTSAPSTTNCYELPPCVATARSWTASGPTPAKP